MVVLKSFVLGALAATVAAKSAVLDLIPSNFDDVVLKSGKPTLVEFFAPWCGHCKNLAPVYEELATAFESSKDVQIAKVDADAERDLGKRFGVQGFPTLKWFDGKSDKPIDYNGGRDLESLSNFVTEKTSVKPRKKYTPPSAVNMLTDETFKTTIGSDKDVLVAFTAPWCGHCKNLAPTWETLAQDFILDEGVVIAKVDAESENSKGTAAAEGVSSYPTIKFFPKGSKEGELYTGGRKEEDFIAFINEKAGTHRTAGGALDAIAGTIASLDKVVAKYTGGTTLADAAAEAKKEAESLKEQAQYKYAEYYVRVFDKLNKSDGYAAKELARLDGILKKGGLAPAKRDEITSKTNILRKFLEKAEEKVADAKEEL
ncbi:Protein disulfide-isomerase erp38 [Colletotrichum musicola]|uniref:protein disulfide-isomerase n=2 Tax=Colletotrichum orchidearum species complex TaxID=2707337 RepID=A0A8H6KEF1_9PEZI|nr:Protein disulfide-isomerase erp38 [Colletotrichum musicola]KAF6836268.1 Protein disulfide-isomerase erp38 [Colletotrichum plurivorum]